MSKLMFGITKLVSKKQEDLAGFDLMALTFAEAYAELRRACPRGDLRIHLSIEADSAEEIGVVLDKGPRDFGERDSTGRLRTASERWPDGAPT